MTEAHLQDSQQLLDLVFGCELARLDSVIAHLHRFLDPAALAG